MNSSSSLFLLLRTLYVIIVLNSVFYLIDPGMRLGTHHVTQDDPRAVLDFMKRTSRK
jgi:hypothetical protein